MNAARGILAGAALGALLWCLATGVALYVHGVMVQRDARLCALESYGTDAAIAQCYTDRGLAVPENFDAYTEE